MDRRIMDGMSSRHGRVLAAVPSHAESAREVLTVASLFAGRLGAELVIVAVASVAIPRSSGEGLVAAGGQGEALLHEQAVLNEAARARAEAILVSLPEHVVARIVIGRGRPGPAIMAAVKEQEAAVIVVGMRRAGRTGHLLHDGADRYVLHHSTVPVLVVPSGAGTPHSIAASPSQLRLYAV